MQYCLTKISSISETSLGYTQQNEHVVNQICSNTAVAQKALDVLFCFVKQEELHRT